MDQALDSVAQEHPIDRKMNVGFHTGGVQKHRAQIQGFLQNKLMYPLSFRCTCFAQEAIDDLPHIFFRQPSRITLDGAFGWHLDPIKPRDLAEPLQERTIGQSRREIAEASTNNVRAIEHRNARTECS